MTYTVELDGRCRIQLPGELLEPLQLSPGSRLQLEHDPASSRIVLSVSTEPVPEPTIEWIDGMPVITGGVASSVSTRDQINYMRAERAAHVTGPPYTALDFLEPEDNT